VIDWIETQGPPLCGPVNTVRLWMGREGSSIGNSASDFDRACQVLEYAERLQCGDGDVLVLGDEPLRSALILLDQHPLIARWWSCTSGDAAEKALGTIPSQLPNLSHSLSITVDSYALAMIDSAHRAEIDNDCRLVSVANGDYQVTTEVYERPGEFRFLLHRFLLK
jgi:hypothetical protein